MGSVLFYGLFVCHSLIMLSVSYLGAKSVGNERLPFAQWAPLRRRYALTWYLMAALYALSAIAAALTHLTEYAFLAGTATILMTQVPCGIPEINEDRRLFAWRNAYFSGMGAFFYLLGGLIFVIVH